MLVVSFTEPAKLRAYLQCHAIPFPAVADPTRTAYHTLELGHGSWWMFLRGHVIGRYLKHMTRGWLPEKTSLGDDLLQLGGDFVLDATHHVVFAFASKEATDRPAVGQLIETLTRLNTE